MWSKKIVSVRIQSIIHIFECSLKCWLDCKWYRICKKLYIVSYSTFSEILTFKYRQKKNVIQEPQAVIEKYSESFAESTKWCSPFYI